MEVVFAQQAFGGKHGDQGERIGRQRLADNEIIGAIQPVSVPGIQGVTVRDRPGKGKLPVKGFRGGAGKGDQPVCFVGNKEGERVVEIIGVDGFVQIAFRKVQPQNSDCLLYTSQLTDRMLENLNAWERTAGERQKIQEATL